ncbi:hypothetical protein IE53DRAFT_359482 [Violaceomyces palustris]|uniref:Uncharacterized protein n=1 Tax=Violaceomyces palustris TaxID=1673888 RepID=A0ACD0P7Z6_9BASI|nr:hypothetical protein IE53DRAFT_359482 [Violaceomyces palustris]
MPTSLPDPVLALSLANVQKLNDLNLDQLANLWNVFTKCKESLESGRRLENLSWRLWFREAHLLPPDASLSDLTDMTPIDTPLMSRANSVASSYQQSKPSAFTCRSAGLSDPESDADTSSESDSCEGSQKRGRPGSGANSYSSNFAEGTTKPRSKISRRRLNGEIGPSSANGSTSRIDLNMTSAAGPSRPSQARNRASFVEPSHTDSSRGPSSRRNSTAFIGAESASSKASGSRRASEVSGKTCGEDRDRKRAVSSSSAFGSRARVKQRNQSVSRRRPLSFQAAIEVLVLNKGVENFCSLAQKRNSVAGVRPDSASETQAIDSPARPTTVEDENTVESSSAPAEYGSTSHSHAEHSSPLQERLEIASHVDPNEQEAAHGAVEAESGSQASTQCMEPETSGPVSPSKMTVQVANLADPHSCAASASRDMPPPSGVPSHKPAAKAFKQALTSSYRKPVPRDLADTVPASKATEDLPNREAAIDVYVASPQTMVYSGKDSASSEARPLRATTPEQTRHLVKEAIPDGKSSNANGQARLDEAKPRQAKAKEAVRQPTLTAAHRSKSATGLHRGKNSKSFDRLPSRAGRLPSTNLLAPGLTMTKTSSAAPKPAAPAAAQVQPQPRKPVKFTMGGDESDSFEDESDDDKLVAQPANHATPARPTVVEGKKEAMAQQVDAGDDDEWSSDDSEDSEEERKAQAKAAAEKRQREEFERQSTMFKKIPIRSASAADVRLLPQQGGPSPPAQPVRGLLSSLFHPEEQHSPPGQLAGRPHASAADLRARPSLSSGLAMTQHSQQPGSKPRNRSKERRSSNPSAAPLRTSKSAVALPVLNTRALSSSTGKAKLNQEAQHSGEEASSAESNPGARPSSIALAKLNALASMKNNSNRRRSGEIKATVELLQDGPRLEPRHVDDVSLPASYEVQTTNELQQQHQGMGRRSKSDGFPEPSAPLLARPRSSANLPDLAAPQTPRTTRRNMLRDELSESLRQNLLWERQLRPRMLGIGAIAPNPAPVRNQKETVLGGGPLRPLTSTNGTSSQRPNSERRHFDESGSFHHTGW